MASRKEKRKKQERLARHQKKRQPKKYKSLLIVGLLTLLLIFSLVLVFTLNHQSQGKEVVSSKTVEKEKKKKLNSKNKSSSSSEKVELPAQGPVIAYAGNFPDPAVIYDNGSYYMYATKIHPVSVPMATSPTNTNYIMQGNVLNPLAPYSNGYTVTSPTVVKIGNQYVMYADMSVGPFSPQRNFVIGAATAATPAGPFIPTSAQLIGFGTDNFFDPAFYTENGKNYLVFATDGTQGNNIWIHSLSSDGLSMPEENSTLLLDFTTVHDSSGAQSLRVESPALLKAPDGTYVLFFAGNNAEEENCYIGYATSKTLTGPYKDQGPLLTSEMFQGQFNGPGEVSTFEVNGKHYMAFNGWVGEHSGFKIISGGRYAYTLEYVWKNGHIPYFNTTVTQ